MQDSNNAHVDYSETSFVAGEVDVVALINDGAAREDDCDEAAVHFFQKANPRKNLSATFEQVIDTQTPSTTATEESTNSVTTKLATVLLADGKPEHSKNVTSSNVQCKTILPSSVIRPPLHASTNQLDPAKRNLAVYLRIRPLKDPLGVSTMEVLPTTAPDHFPTAVRTHPPASKEIPTHRRPSEAHVKQFDFTQILPSTSSQRYVYDTVAAPLIQNLLNATRATLTGTNTGGINNRPPASALLFSYGITNAGKTHTILGNLKHSKTDDNTRDWGIIPRTIQQVLDRTSQENLNLDLYLSFFEIYQENVYDLLPQTTNRYKNNCLLPEALKVRESKGQTLVRGLAKHKVRDLRHGIDLTLTAHNRRHTSSNNLNTDSSRSHCVCQLQLIPSRILHTAKPLVLSSSGYSTEDEISSNGHASTIWIVDLAGSERSKRTQSGIARQKEASQINRSLMTLMRCLTAMRENKSATIIPFRESKVTHVFMGHLTGPYSANTAMIVNVNPSVQDFEETQHVLGYAVSAKLITMDEEKLKRSQSAAEESYDMNGHRRIPLVKSTSSSALVASKQSAAEESYDMNGHRRIPLVKSTSSSALVASKKRAPVTKSVSSNGGILSKMVNGLKKLSPMKRHHRTDKRKLPLPPSHSENFWKRCRVDEVVTVPQTRVQEQTAKPDENDELTATKDALRQAQGKIKRLESEKDELLEDLALQEHHIRGEVSEEMEHRLKVARERSLQEVERMRVLLEQQHEQSQTLVRQAQQDHLDRQLEALMDKVDECEEEMKRMRQDHETQIAEYQAQIQALHQESANRIAQLESALEASRSQVDRLKRTKMELMENYEQQLRNLHNAEANMKNDKDEEDEFCSEDDNVEDDEIEDSTNDKEDEKDGDDDVSDDEEDEENTVPLWKQKFTRTRKMQQPMPRRILGAVPTNHESQSSASDASVNISNKLVFPKRQSVLDDDGMYRRPMGRAPKGHEWDASLGAWKAILEQVHP